MQFFVVHAWHSVLRLSFVSVPLQLAVLQGPTARARPRFVRYYASGSITSRPPMYGTSTSGTFTEPSACW